MKNFNFRCNLWIAALLLVCFGVGRAQENPETAPVTNPVPVAANARVLNGAPLFWAEGITATDDLTAYKSIGFNAVVVRLSWDPAAGSNLAALDLAPQRDFAEAAAKAGLKVIYALPAVPQGMEFQVGRIAGDSPSYNLLWKTWVTGAISVLRDTPNLVGWMLPDDPRALPIFDDAGFRRWVGRNYANLDVLNERWGSSFKDLSEITMADASALAESWRQRDQSNNSALGQLGAPDASSMMGDNLAFHPAALALGAYKWEAYRTLLSMWIGQVRGADAGHLLFSGRLPDYAQLLSVPAGVDVITPAVAPGLAENDIVTHNPQAIDIARRGGKFAALPIFSAQSSNAVPAEALPDLCKRWIQEACARGAAGVAFDNWQIFKTDLNLRQATLEKLAELNRAPAEAFWNDPPVATTAIILTPLADGATLGFGPPELGQRRGLYGWAQDLVDGEPSNLVWAMRWGTAFGGVDYLSPDDLDGPLDAYNTILAPQMLSCSLDNQTALINYVGAGGVLVADLGLGALQSGGEVRDLPPGMKLLFGVQGNYDVRPYYFNLNAAAPHPLLPKWNEMMQLARNVALTRGDGPDASAFNGPVGFSIQNPSALTVATGPQIGTKTGAGTLLLRAPLTINDSGRGAAIWAPFRLWNLWRPGSTGFQGELLTGFDFFHGNLMARGATLAIRPREGQPKDDIVPAPANLPEGVTRFPEIINRAQDVTFVDHDAPGQPVQLASVETVGVGDWLWSGGITQLSNATPTGLTGGRPAPIPNPEPIESRLRPLTLYAALAPGEMKTLHMEPVSVQNLGGGPLFAQVLSSTNTELEVNVWPNAMVVLPSMAGDEWQPVPTVAARFRVTVCPSDSGLKLKPGARLRATITSYEVAPNKKPKAKTSQQVVVVDARGRATLEFESSACRIQLTPGA